jgi:hypothetical protein
MESAAGCQRTPLAGRAYYITILGKVSQRGQIFGRLTFEGAEDAEGRNIKNNAVKVFLFLVAALSR